MEQSLSEKQITDTPQSVSVIISTYNNPRWLKKTLWGYANQSVLDFEIVIADDGSGEETRMLIEEFREHIFPNIKHVWHPDNGFEKTKILNKAILAAKSEYLIFTDQDCIPRKDFIAKHISYAQKGYFLSGGYFKLPMSISEKMNEEDIVSGRAFRLSWLRENGLKLNFKSTKLVQSTAFTSFMNFITPTKASWNGCNSSGWRADILAVNGFNEQMKYGGEDREFGERLFNYGIHSKQLRYSVICIHLDHARPYKNKEAFDRNDAIRKDTKKNRIIQTPFGIKPLAD